MASVASLPVRQTCADLFTNEAGLPAWCDVDRAKSFAAGLDIELIRKQGSSLANDANATRVFRAFQSVDEEAALIVVLHALDFGGGWRRELHESNAGKGAFVTVKAGVERLFDAQPDLNSAWLAALTTDDVARLFQLEGKPALSGFVEQLTSVCRELGGELVKRGLSTVSAFLQTFFTAASQQTAANLVKHLVETFPITFNDAHTVRGRSVIFYKKAQLVVGELYHRFRAEDKRFCFPDADDELTAFIDNVIVACLRKDKLVVCNSQLEEMLEAQQPLLSGTEEEVCLRAAACLAIETVVATARQNGQQVTSCEVGNWLWGILGKTPEYRPFKRHAIHNTVFY